MDFFKKTWDNTWTSFPHHINQFQTSIKFSLQFRSWVDVMLLAILNMLKSFRWYFLVFAINWIYWELELLQHLNMKCNNNFYVNITRFSAIWLFPGKSLYNIPTQPFSTTCKHHYKIINQGMENLWHMSCLKCHVHNKLTGFRRVYLGIGSLVCIINFLVAPVGNLLMRLGCQGKGTEEFSRQ